MDWVTGVKLTGLPPEEIRHLVATGQEAFLTQLLEVGFFHGDPHPGNLLKVYPLSSHWHMTQDTVVMVRWSTGTTPDSRMQSPSHQ